jgi:hypothetical protein
MSTSVRNCNELGENLQKLVKRLAANQNLLKLLYYTSQDPLSQPDITDEQFQKEIFEKLIKIVPRVSGKDNSKSIIVLRVSRGVKNPENTEFKDVTIMVEIFVPLSQWIMVGTNLRPFAILGEIEKSLANIKINGLGRLLSGGFELSFLTDEIGAYEQLYSLTSYD